LQPWLQENLSSSSDEEDLIPDTSRDFEFTQRLYSELNRDLLGLSDDGKIIILSDSDEKKEEVREEKYTDTVNVAASAALNTASVNDVDAPTGAKNNNSNDQEAGDEDSDRDDAGEP
jgi:hypothetical protein